MDLHIGITQPEPTLSAGMQFSNLLLKYRLHFLTGTEKLSYPVTLMTV